MENVTRYLNTKYVHDEAKVAKATRKLHFLNDTEIFDENDEPTGYELKSRKRNVQIINQSILRRRFYSGQNIYFKRKFQR